ncbi:NAD(P)/FAD-dependent oxidoreductase [Halorutilales archaeon Cl-col2-1]
MSEYVIIGDGIAGSTAAETLREESDSAEITVITDEPEPLYNRINIKEYAKGKMPEEEIRMHDEEWYDENDIDLMLNTRVNRIDNDNSQVILHNEETVEYDKLLVAAGGKPWNLPVPHGDADGIHNFWTFVDSRRIRRDAEEADSGVIVGAGLLGIDFAYAMGENNVDAKYLMRGDRWWRYGIDKDGAEIIHDELRSIGVEPVFQEGVERFGVDRMGSVEECVGTSGEVYDCDIAGVCIGLDLNTDLMEGTEVETNDGIVVDETLQTKDEDIYAAGDIAEFYDPITQEYKTNGSWDSAMAQGERAAKNMLNPDDAEAFEFVSTYSVAHFSMPFISLGSPPMADTYESRKYGEKEYRRLCYKDGRLIGAILIGNVRPVGKLTKIIEDKMDIEGHEHELLEEEIDLASIMA